MNRKLLSLVLAGMLALASLTACVTTSSAPEAQNTVSVNGAGTAYGTPDIATAQIGVQSRNADPAQAVDENNRKMAAIIAALKNLGVEDQDIQTTNFSVQYQQDYDPLTGQARETFTYIVDNTVNVIIRDLSKVGDVLGKVVGAGANSIYGVTFSVSDTAKLESEARLKAMADAQARAEQLAQAAGVNLDKPLSINEYSSGPVYAAADLAGGKGGGGAAPVPVSTGQIQVTLNVSITYLIK
jgi:uncharacterized protein YggE